MKLKLLSLILMVVSFSLNAQAAQVGKVIVDQAQVHQYPKVESQVTGSVARDEVMAVSNVPIEGFYKARLKDGSVGWISGNDVFVSAPEALAEPQVQVAEEKAEEKIEEKAFTPDLGEAAKPAPIQPIAKNALKNQPKSTQKNKSKKLENESPERHNSHTRLLFSYGMQTPSYDGLKNNTGNNSNFTAANLSNRNEFSFELQTQMSEDFYWALRIEYLTMNTGSNAVPNGLTQNITQYSLPVMLGIHYSPMASRFRIGIGAFIGATALSSLTVTQTVTATGAASEPPVIFNSQINPSALCNIQLSYAFTGKTAFFVEGGYRYERTGTLPASSYLGGMPAFTIDYSGPYAHLGLEFRF